MPFQDFIRVPQVVDLSYSEKTEAIKALVSVLCRALGTRKQKPLVDEILKREESASTFIGHGIAIPHTRAPIKDKFSIVIGRSIDGIQYDAARGAKAHVIVLVVGREGVEPEEHIRLLTEIASFFKAEDVMEDLMALPGPVEIIPFLSQFSSDGHKEKTTRKTIDPVLLTASNLAREIKASAVLVFADAAEDNDFLDQFKTKNNLIVVTSNKNRFDSADRRIKACIQSPAFVSERIGKIKIGVLLALSQNLINKDDKVVCLSGNPKHGVFDTIIMLNIDREFDFFFTATHAILPPDVKPEVLERVLGLAGEIAVEGREGKPTGTIFVIGDTNSVNLYTRQLIINPFRGYSEAERNIMDPSLDETIKEFAGIDGAFIITGDGIVLSAGSYLRPEAEVDLPSGFGARHVAAAATTACTNALAITISESTGTVTLFKNGAIMMSLTKPVGRYKGNYPESH